MREYNITSETALSVGDKLKDEAGNHYIVVELEYQLLGHSQYASKVLVDCYKGRHKGQTRWVNHQLALAYKV
tara:strand:- start:254 stop:469 length:216 start_codon:yes stop_codon:yes gene_type:complete